MGLSFLRPFSKLPRGTPLFPPRPISSTPPLKCLNFPASQVTGLEREALHGFISEKMKATEVAHSIWRSVLRKGDSAVDATCGNGHDTLFLLRLVAVDSVNGFVYGFDVQNSALEMTHSLLAQSVHDPFVRERVKLSLLCHSRMEDVVPEDAGVRLVAFNLGYLPGGDREIITLPETTLPALEAASRIVASGGLISVLVYVGHPGGRDEYETVQAFASGLPSESWSCCKLERLNRPTAPVLVLLFKK